MLPMQPETADGFLKFKHLVPEEALLDSSNETPVKNVHGKERTCDGGWNAPKLGQMN